MSRPTAYLHLREDPHYRLDAFRKGFERMGFHVENGEPHQILTPNDAVVIWNKSLRSDNAVALARAGGAPVIVAENGYYGKDEQGRSTYALALDGHCGSGRWYVGDSSRFDALNIEFKPWRTPQTRRVLIAAQRGIGSPRMASPQRFAENMADWAYNFGYAPIIRTHPGRDVPQTPLMDDLDRVSALIVWSSNCATQALIEGIPTYYCAPHIVTQDAAIRFKRPVMTKLVETDREAAFIKLAWAQAFVSEIEDASALERLLKVHAGELPSCQVGLGL